MPQKRKGKILHWHITQSGNRNKWQFITICSLHWLGSADTDIIGITSHRHSIGQIRKSDHGGEQKINEKLDITLSHSLSLSHSLTHIDIQTQTLKSNRSSRHRAHSRVTLCIYICGTSKSSNPNMYKRSSSSSSTSAVPSALSAVREVHHILVDLIAIAHSVIHHDLHQIQRHALVGIHHAHAREDILPNRQQRQARGPVIGQ